MTEGGKGCFALVTYLPEPLSRALQAICAALPGNAHSRPHVTVLPPRPLLRPAREIFPAIADIIGGTAPFEVGLEQVCLFPDTRVLYLSIGKGRREIEHLHATLVGHQDDDFREEHVFRPHLTLAGPLLDGQLSAATREAQTAWSKINTGSCFKVDRIEFLQLAPGGAKADWKQIWWQELGVGDLRNEAKPA